MPANPSSPIDRRAFLTRSAAIAAAAAAITLFHALVARADQGRDQHRGERGCSPDYGPLAPVRDETTGLPLLLLPDRFEYLTFGWTGDLLTNGTPTPGAHDGMAAFGSRHGRVRLIRNHEIGSSGGAFAPGLAYDPAAGGGTTTLEFDARRGQFVEAWPSIAGTEQRRPERGAERDHRRLPGQRVRGRDLQPRRQVAVLQHPEPGDDLRGHRALAQRLSLILSRPRGRGVPLRAAAVPPPPPGAIGGVFRDPPEVIPGNRRGARPRSLGGRPRARAPTTGS
jgi:Bacterial protein of unknown function (DUF839)